MPSPKSRPPRRLAEAKRRPVAYEQQPRPTAAENPVASTARRTWSPNLVPMPRRPADATDADLDFLASWFTHRRYEYALQEFRWEDNTRASWMRLAKERHPALSRDDLRSSLEQRQAIAVFAPMEHVSLGDRSHRMAMTRYLLVDIDYQDDHADVVHRAARVQAVLGAPTFVLASPGGGAHLVYLLTEAVPLWRLRGPGGRTGMVMRLLQAHGLDEARGEVEVFPAAHTWVWPENGCRLPFGPGAYLLDPNTLEIVDHRLVGVRALRHVRYQLESGAWELTDPTPWIEGGLSVRLRKGERTGFVGASGRELALAHVGDLLERGLTAYGQRRRAVVALAHLWWFSDGVSEDEAVARTQQWLAAKHNGCSRDWNAARDVTALLDECNVIVRSVFAARRRKQGGERPVELPLLTLDDVRALVAVAVEVARATRAGKPVQVRAGKRTVRIDAVKLVEVGVLLLRRLLRRLLRKSGAALERSGGATDATYQQMIRRCWTDFSRRVFRLPLPREEFVGSVAAREAKPEWAQRAVGKDAAPAYLRFLCERLPDQLRLASDYFAQGEKCRDFWVHLELDGDRVISTGAEALARLVSADEIRSLVSRHVWKEKLASAFAAVAHGTAEATAASSRQLLALQSLWTKAREGDDARAGEAVPQQPASIPTVPDPIATLVAPDWADGLRTLPETVRDSIDDISIGLCYVAPLEIVPEADASDLPDVNGATCTLLIDALADAFPNARLSVSGGVRGYRDLAIRVAAAPGTDLDAARHTRAVRLAIGSAVPDAIRQAARELNFHGRRVPESRAA